MKFLHAAVDTLLDRGAVAPAVSRKRETVLFLIVGALLCGLTFAVQLSGFFVWDDAYIVRDNPSLHSWNGLWRNFTEDTWHAAGRGGGQFYRPLLVATFWVQARLGAQTVLPYRIVNVALHLFAALLFLRVLRRFAIAPLVALAAAWLFVIHPAVTEPVMLLVGRQEQLGVLFCLAALLVWPAPQAERPVRFRVLATVFVFCAFLSKEGYLIAPLLIALAHVIWHRDRLDRRAAAWFLLPCGAVALGFVLRAGLGIGSGSVAVGQSPLMQLKVGAAVIAHYGGLTATLSNGPTFNPFNPLGGAAAALVLVPLCAAGIVLLLSWRRAPIPALGGVWMGLVWFAVALAPIVVVVPVLGMYQNRYAYFPLLGALLAVASVVELTRTRVRDAFATLRILRAVLAVACAGLLGLTLVRTRLEASLWMDNLTLYDADVRHNPGNGFALYHFGFALWEQGGCKSALPVFARAARYAPGYSRAWNNFTGCLVELRRYTEAIAPAQHALELSPDNPATHYHMGAAWLGTGQRDKGLAELGRALALNPAHRPTLTLLTEVGADPRL